MTEFAVGQVWHWFIDDDCHPSYDVDEIFLLLRTELNDEGFEQWVAASLFDGALWYISPCQTTGVWSLM